MYPQRRASAPPAHPGPLLANGENNFQMNDLSSMYLQSSSGLPPSLVRRHSERTESTDLLGTPSMSQPPHGCRLFRRRTWEFLTSADTAPHYLQRAATIYQIFTTLAILTIFIVDTNNEQEFGEVATSFVYGLEVLLLVVFCAEYMLRIFSCVEEDCTDDSSSWQRCRTRLCRVVSPIMILDLICIISMLYNQIQTSNKARGFVSLRLLRLLNIFRVERNFQMFRPVLIVIWNKRRELGSTMGIAAILLVIASATMYYIESPTNGEFTSIIESMWWATTALTTVGYGDVFPHSPLGKVFGSIVAFTGVGLFALPAGIIASGFESAYAELEAEKRGQEAITTETRLTRLEAKVDVIQSSIAEMHRGQEKLLSLFLSLQAEEFIAWATDEAEENRVETERNKRAKKVFASKSKVPSSPAVWAYDKDDPSIQLLRQKLRAAAYVDGDYNFDRFFRFLRTEDENGLKEMGFKEFKAIIRKEGKANQEMVSDQFLKGIFKDLNTGNTGTIKCSEFVEWVTPTKPQPSKRSRSLSRASSAHEAESEDELLAKIAKTQSFNLLKGWFSLLRKDKNGNDKADRRLVVLFDDHIEYYIDAEAAERGQVRGNIQLAGVSHIDETETGFVIHIAEVVSKDNPRPARSLELKTETDAETCAWLEALGPRFAKIDWGPQPIPKMKREEQDKVVLRFNGLSLKTIGEDAFKEKLRSELQNNVGISSSEVSRLSITLREGSIIAEVSGHALRMQKVKEKASEKSIVVLGSHSILVKKTKGTMKKREESPLSSSPGRGAGSAFFPEEATRAVPSTKILYQGPLGMVKKGKPEARHFVLYEERLDYFMTVEHMLGGDPRGRVMCKDIKGLDFAELTINVTLADRVLHLNAPLADFENWQTCLSIAMKRRNPSESSQGTPTALPMSVQMSFKTGAAQLPADPAIQESLYEGAAVPDTRAN